MNRMWMAAALPLALMALMFLSFWLDVPWVDKFSLLTCVVILAGAVLTGLCVLCLVLAGWWRGGYTLGRGDILAATVLASLDVLIPTTLVVLLWLLLRNMKHGLMF